MKKLYFVVLLLLSTQCVAEDLDDSLKNIESEWARIYYNTASQKQEAAYIDLLNKTIQLSSQHPKDAEPLFWQAVIKATYAEHQDAVSALQAIHEARDLLLKAIKINPKTMNGSGYVTLGTLYYMAPKWPVAFGDEVTAKEMLQTGLKINPNGIDSNYYYGDFLLSTENFKEAEKYFERALTVPSRSEQLFADNKLKEEAKQALKNLKSRNNNAKDLFVSLFGSTSNN